MSGDEADRPVFRIHTDRGEFAVPRTFAVPVWRDLRPLSFRSNYFVMQLPADFVAERVEGYAPRLNHFTQDVVVAVEALSPSRLRALWGSPTQRHCEFSAHDLAPESVPYRRCEYRRLSARLFAVKFWLGGDNNDLIDEVSELVLETVGGWLVSPAEGERTEGEGAASP